MRKVVYKKEMVVQEELAVSFESENIGIQITGWEKSKFEFSWELESTEITEQDLESDFEIEYNKEDNKLEIDTSEIESKYKFSKSKMTLFVPHKTSVKASLENGYVKLNTLNGNQKIETANGPIFLSEVEGKITLNSENGLLKLNHLSGDLKIEIDNGSIKIDDSKGKLDVEGENGQIKVTNSNYENATIRNENGAIYFEFLSQEQGDFRFENENGKIHLIIPEEIPYNIQAKNRFGNFHIGLKKDYDKHQEDELYGIEMVNGSGNVKIYAENENGSIRLLQKQSIASFISLDASQINKSFDKLAEWLPEEGEMLKEKMEKIKRKIETFDFEMPDVSKIVKNSLQAAEHEIEKFMEKNKTQEETTMMKEKMNELVKKMEKKMNELKENTEEKLQDFKAKEKLQEEIQQVKKQLENMGQFITDKENLEKLKQKMTQLKTKFEEHDIHLPNFEKLYEDTLKTIEKEIQNRIEMEKWKKKGKEIAVAMKGKLDDVMKNAEEKITDIDAKEKLQEEIQYVKKQLDKMGEFITDEENLKKVKEKLEQIKTKLDEHDIHLPDFEKLYEDSMKAIEVELKKHIDMEAWKKKGKEISDTLKSKFDEITKYVEEKRKELEENETLQNKLKEARQQLEKVTQFVTDEENLKLVKEKLEQVKSKLEEYDIYLPDFEKIYEDSLKTIEKELDKHVDLDKWKDKGKEISETVKENVNKALDKIELQLSDMEPNEKDRETIEARSRLKILDMVEKKIITAEEGERLIKAMEKKNA